MEGIGAIILIVLGISVASLIFVIWVMYTIAKSLKEISNQTERIAAQLEEFTRKDHGKHQKQHTQNNCWDTVFGKES